MVDQKCTGRQIYLNLKRRKSRRVLRIMECGLVTIIRVFIINTNVTSAQLISNWGFPEKSPVFQGWSFYEAQEQLRPDAFPEVTNYFYRIRAQGFRLKAQRSNHLAPAALFMRIHNLYTIREHDNYNRSYNKHR